MDAFMLNTLCGLPVSMTCDYAVTRMVPFKRPWTFVILYSLGGTGLRIALYYLGLAGANDIVQMALMVAVIAVFSYDKLPTKLFAAVTIMSVMMVGELSLNFVVKGFGLGISADSTSIVITNMGKFLAARAMALIICGLLCYIAVLLWDRILGKSKPRAIWVFLAFPLTQLLLIWYAQVLAAKSGGALHDYVAITILTVASAIADCVMLKALDWEKRAEEAAGRAELLELQLDQQKEYYRRVMCDAEETARIRHDMRNEIQAAYSLLRAGEDEWAEKLFSELTDKVSASSYFCRNAVVNAVMSEKSEDCRAAGITLRHELDIRADIPIDEVELCSLIANVMDNSIKGCRESRAEEPYIDISAAENKGYLVLECSNSAKPPDTAGKKPKNVRDEHGWGLSILENIAQKYDGKLDTGFDGGIYRIAVFLKCDAVK